MTIGAWSDVFALPNAAIHCHLLPNGKVLFWGRRDSPDGTLDDHFCTPYVWDPATGQTVATPQPARADGSTVNLFCSGHSLLPDGRLLVAGGHFKDGMGLDQACLYDWTSNAWTPLPPMNHGRWYPTVITLADGAAVVLSGSYATSDGHNIQNNNIPQLWDGHAWQTLSAFPGDGSPNAGPIELFPTLHVAPDGRLFMSGPAMRSYFLDTAGDGTWTPLTGPGGQRDSMRRDYAPSVMYDVGKVVYIGGGNNPVVPQTPTSAVEVIDLNAAAPAWRTTNPMHFARRQHNATLLPDGSVLVTGGTQGEGFNDLRAGKPVHDAELWDPATEQWTVVAAESVDRCYHSTAILLPDATVLSAGGGEFDIGNHTPNPPTDTHRNAQIYRPDYLFRGERPKIIDAPPAVGYSETFPVRVDAPDAIAKVTWLRLSSVTHTDNMNQRINVLDFEVVPECLLVRSPARSELCPPGHYMLFVLNGDGVPSVAHIMCVSAVAAAPARGRTAPAQAAATLEDVDRAVRRAAVGTQVALGLTSKCPYGLGACWGGAYEALVKLDGVTAVRPVANAVESTADVYLGNDALPDVDRWAQQIAATANGSYDLRGVEVSVTGIVRPEGGGLVLTGPALPTPVPLRPLGTTDKVQYDHSARSAHPATPTEQAAFGQLAAQPSGAAPTRVIGPLVRDGATWTIRVRAFEPG
jgi:galactose oxidase